MSSLKPNARGLSLSVVLAGLSALCWFAVLLLPQRPLAHRWLGPFAEAPVASLKGGGAAVLTSFLAGWFAAFLMAITYNRLIKTGA